MVARLLLAMLRYFTDAETYELSGWEKSEKNDEDEVNAQRVHN